MGARQLRAKTLAAVQLRLALLTWATSQRLVKLNFILVLVISPWRNQFWQDYNVVMRFWNKLSLPKFTQRPFKMPILAHRLTELCVCGGQLCVFRGEDTSESRGRSATLTGRVSAPRVWHRVHARYPRGPSQISKRHTHVRAFHTYMCVYAFVCV